MGPPLPSKSIAHAKGSSSADATILSFWIDYACPFSARFFKRMNEEVMPHYEGKNIRFEFYHQIQPWHVASGIMHETSLAVAEECGEDVFWQFSKELFDKRESFTDIYTFDVTRHDLTEDILNQCLIGQNEETFEKVRKYARLNKETEDKSAESKLKIERSSSDPAFFNGALVPTTRVGTRKRRSTITKRGYSNEILSITNTFKDNTFDHDVEREQERSLGI